MISYWRITWTSKRAGFTADKVWSSTTFVEGTRIYLALTNGVDAPQKYDPQTGDVTDLSDDADLPKGQLCFTLADRVFIGPMTATDQDFRFEHSKDLDVAGATAWSESTNFVQIPGRSIPQGVVVMGDVAFVLNEEEIFAILYTGDAVTPFWIRRVGDMGTLSFQTIKVLPGENAFVFLGTDGMVYKFDLQSRLEKIGVKIPGVLFGSDDTDFSGLNKAQIAGAVAGVDPELQKYMLFVPDAGDSYNSLALDYYWGTKLIDIDPVSRRGSGLFLGQWFYSDADVRAIVVGRDSNDKRVILTSSGKPDYVTGTVSISAGGVVTGSGTAFDQSMVGNDFIPTSTGTAFVVTSVAGATSLQLTSYTEGAVAAGEAFTISRRGIVFEQDSGTSDDGAAIDSYWFGRWHTLGRIDLNKHFPEMDVITRNVGDWLLQINHMVDFQDGVGLQNTINLAPDSAVVGTAIVGTAVIGSLGAVPRKVPTNSYGKAIRYRFRTNGLNEKFTLYGYIPYVEATS